MEIPKIESFWDEQLVSPAHSGHRHSGSAVPQPVGSGGTGAHSPYERNLNFATVAVEDGDYGFPKKKTVRDPLSHRIIEKRRRDRMNNCLADLARLLPPSSLRKGRGRIEKTEIVELAIKHLRHLQCHPCPMGDKCEFSGGADTSGGATSGSPTQSIISSSSMTSGFHSSYEEQFRFGFQECLSEAMHFLVEQEGMYAGDTMCVRLVKHLNNHCETALRDRDHWGNQGKLVPGFRRNPDTGGDFKKTGSSSSGYHPNGSSSGSDGNGGNGTEMKMSMRVKLCGGNKNLSISDFGELDGESTEPFALPVQNNPPQHLNIESSRHSSSVMDYEAENSCSSTPLSIETSDVLSSDGKNNSRMSTKPPIPSIICSHSSSNNSGSPANGSNGRSSDDGSGNSSTSSAHRYKFKSNIKQRFTADCQTIDDRSRFTSTSGGGKCGGPHEAVEADREIDISSDTEEIREDTPGPEDAMKVSHHGNQSAGEETESKPLPQSPMNQRRLSGGAICTGGKSGPQISVIGTSPEDRNVFSSAAPNSPTMDINKSCGTSVALDMDNSTSHDVNEVKPCPEDLAAAMQNLNGPSKHKIPLPIFITGEEATPGKGIPAFALHEKGRFYIPVTLDKSLAGPYMNKFDTCVAAAPPLYPVTISVCFVVGTDKKGKCETVIDAEVSTVEGEKAADFSPPTNNHVPLPLVTSSGSNLLKPNRRTYRENHYVSSRFGHQRSAPSSKDSNMGNSRIGSAETSSSSFHASYQDGNSSASSPAPPCNDFGRASGEESETHSGSTGCSRTGGSSSCSSGTAGSATRGRKRSVSSSPSLSGSGASAGYHSWNEKGSTNSHEYYPFHSNTHNLSAISLHSHLTANVSPSTIAAMNHRHPQSHPGFHSETSPQRRDKELSYNREKRSKKTRSVDQLVVQQQ